jgi:3-oxoacyl-[acyl-carrier protein] reductase
VTPLVAPSLDREAVERATRTYALRKVATPEDVARAIVWISSPAAGHTTGEVLAVAGGMEGRMLW